MRLLLKNGGSLREVMEGLSFTTNYFIRFVMERVMCEWEEIGVITGIVVWEEKVSFEVNLKFEKGQC